MKKFLRAVLNTIVFILSGKGELADEMIAAGVINYSGQGRDCYGR